MDVLLGHSLGEAGFAALLGSAAVRLAVLAKQFRERYQLPAVRRALLSKRPWFLVATRQDDRAFAVRAEDGVCIPWNITSQLEAALCVPKMGALFAIDARAQGSTIWAWDVVTGHEWWRIQTSVKLLRPLFFIESIADGVICAGAFEGVFMWGARTGLMAWQARTALPVDRVWHFRNEMVFVRTSEVLGLASELLVWKTKSPDAALNSHCEADASCFDASDRSAWTKKTMEMIMALACSDEAAFARIGGMIFAWNAFTGAELWCKKEEILPRLPTLPTHLAHSSTHDLLFIGVQCHVLALNASSSEERFRIKLPGALLKQVFTRVPKSSVLVGVVGGCTKSVMSWDVATGARLSIWGLSPQVATVSAVTVECRVFVGMGLHGEQGAVAALDLLNGGSLWQVFWSKPVVNVSCAQAGVVCGVTVGEVFGLSADAGLLLWQTEISSTVMFLTFVDTCKKAIAGGGESHLACKPM
eukprot:TRINITY_DN56293_c0_g1_i1.p1 TRINITY_DN56293_c0_g1~~TRINITY_DN56293_c0_g1_i1.p1  ORF type:complete len:506 (-),score=75.95 TRINITY_DN56293_c0_g1_i1:167-1582(-)